MGLNIKVYCPRFSCCCNSAKEVSFFPFPWALLAYLLLSSLLTMVMQCQRKVMNIQWYFQMGSHIANGIMLQLGQGSVADVQVPNNSGIDHVHHPLPSGLAGQTACHAALKCTRGLEIFSNLHKLFFLFLFFIFFKLYD